MGLLGSMTVAFNGNSSGLVSAVNGAKNAIASLASSPVGKVGTGLLAIGAIAVGVGVQAVKMAGDFEEGITQLQTGAGEAKGNLQLVSDGILKLAVSTGTTTKQLLSGMFMIESAGYHGAQGLQVLQVAAQGAKVGNADLGVTANALTTILTDYHMKTGQSADAMNMLTAVVANGKTHLQDVAGAMGSILPLASSLGIAFPQVGGAISTMTNAGMSAQRASMNLANAIRALAAPGGSASKAMKEVGITAQQLHDTLATQGLSGALKLVEDHIGAKFPAGSAQATAALKAIMGGATGLNVALMLGGKNFQTYENNIQAVNGAMKTGKGAVMGWADVQNDFNFKMAQAKEVVETLMIKIGTALLPVLSQFLGFVTPLIGKFADWISKSGALQSITSAVGVGVKQFASLVMQLWTSVGPLVIGLANWLIQSGALQGTMSTLGAVLQGVVNAVTGLISGISQTVTFFQQNQAAALALLIPLGALGGYFVYLGVQAIVSFIAAAPAMIAGFISGAAAAWTMAAGVIAATWPFLLIGAAIGLVIAIIILLVTHWGQVVAFLRGAWQGFSSWFMGALKAVGAFFVAIWNGIASAFQAVIAFIVNVVKIGFQLWLAYITFPIRMVAALFVWLYEHNRYFQMLIDAITNIVKAGIAWLVNAWHVVVNAIVAAWQWLVGMASIVWNAIVVFISTQVSRASSFLRSVWSSVVSFLAGIWASISSGVASMWAKISSFFVSAWGTYISGPLHSLWNSITGFVSGWAGQAVQWGKNLIQGLINGITSMIGGVGNAVQGVASKIAGFLGFHSPSKEGPGQELNAWGPNLIKGFASGIQKSIPRIQAAVNMAIKPVQQGFSQYPQNTRASSPSHNASLNNNQPVIFTVELDGQEIARKTAPQIVQHMRLKAGVRA